MALFPKNFLGLGASSTVAETGGVTTAVSFNMKVGKAAEPFRALNASALAVIQKVLWWVIRIAPLGTVGLIGNAVAVYGWGTIGSLGRFTSAIDVLYNAPRNGTPFVDDSGDTVPVADRALQDANA